MAFQLFQPNFEEGSLPSFSSWSGHHAGGRNRLERGQNQAGSSGILWIPTHPTRGVSGQAVQPKPLASLKLSMAVYGRKLDGRPSQMNDQKTAHSAVLRKGR